MTALLLAFALGLLGQTAGEEKTAEPWNIARTLSFEERSRSYHFHLPKSYDPKKATPVVLVLHGAGTNGRIMEYFCGLSGQADKSGFIAVYPDGTGANPLLTWNAGRFPPAAPGKKKPDDVGFLCKVLDDLATAANVDPERVYVVGLSNGGMMAYRFAAERSERVAGMVSIAGTLVTETWQPKYPMPVLHFHGTEDVLVPYMPTRGMRFMKGVDETMSLWAKANGCAEKPKEEEVSLGSGKGDLKVTRKAWSGGKEGTEVVLYTVKEGGHTWPGRDMAFGLLGKSARNISANDLMWEFFQKHPMK